MVAVLAEGKKKKKKRGVRATSFASDHGGR